MTNTIKSLSAQRDDQLMHLLAQLSAATMQRGLEHSRIDDPHNYTQAVKLMTSNGWSGFCEI